MNEREIWLFVWSAVAGFCGWVTWDLKNEKDKCDEQRENYVRRSVRQRDEHEKYDRNG